MPTNNTLSTFCSRLASNPILLNQFLSFNSSYSGLSMEEKLSIFLSGHKSPQIGSYKAMEPYLNESAKPFIISVICDDNSVIKVPVFSIEDTCLDSSIGKDLYRAQKANVSAILMEQPMTPEEVIIQAIKLSESGYFKPIPGDALNTLKHMEHEAIEIMLQDCMTHRYTLEMSEEMYES